MSVTREFKKCEEFNICCAYGDGGEIYIEPASDNYTMYEVVVRGSGRMAKVFDSEYIVGDSKGYNFSSMKRFLGYDTIFESFEPFRVYGFNAITRNEDWDGRLIYDSFTGESGDWLICFDGCPTINDVEMKPMDYSKLDNKRYDVKLNNAVVGVFKKLNKNDLTVSDFYDDTPIDTWKKVIGNDLHYHVGWGEGDLLKNSVKHLYQFVSKNDKILDCGCGWGGTAKMFQRDLDCDVTGITVSKNQYDFVKNNLLMDVIHSDLHNYYPDEKYDVCLFIESFCHLEFPKKVLDNISKYTNKIIIRDYYYKTDDYPSDYMSRWLMNVYKKDELIYLFEQIGFKLSYHEDHYAKSLEPTVNFWLKNLSKLKDDEKTHHINILETSARYMKENLNKILKTIDLATFVFEK